MTLEQTIVALISERAWVPLAALVVGFLTRLAKDDAKGPNVAPRWRPVLALGLGLVAGALDAVATGTSWQEALIGGGVSASMAILGHVGLIEVLRGGEEIALPGLMKPEPAQEKKRITFPPTLLVLLALLTGCAGGQVHPLVAAAADPLLEVIGFCQRNGAKIEDVEAIRRDYAEERKLDAAIKAGLLMHQLAETEGVEIPPEIDRAYRLAVGAIIDGMVEGLRALDGRDANGVKVEGS